MLNSGEQGIGALPEPGGGQSGLFGIVGVIMDIPAVHQQRRQGILVVLVDIVAQLVDTVFHKVLAVLIELFLHLLVVAELGEEVPLPEILLVDIVDCRVTGEILAVGVVAVGPIKVPCGSKDELRAVVEDVLVIAPATLGVQHLVVADILVEHQVTCRIVHVDVGRHIVIVKHRLSKLAEPVLDIPQGENC